MCDKNKSCLHIFGVHGVVYIWNGSAGSHGNIKKIETVIKDSIEGAHDEDIKNTISIITKTDTLIFANQSIKGGEINHHSNK